MNDDNNMRIRRRPLVAVIGSSSADKSIVDIAEQVGREIHSQGWHLLTGGGGGVMEAACRGFCHADREDSGLSVGILPTDEAKHANDFVDISIPTGMGIARNAIIARAAHGLIVVGGCAGTLSEIALAWQMGRPIAAIAHSGGWAENTAGLSIDDRRLDIVFSAQSAREAVDYLKGRIPGA